MPSKRAFKPITKSAPSLKLPFLRTIPFKNGYGANSENKISTIMYFKKPVFMRSSFRESCPAAQSHQIAILYLKKIARQRQKVQSMQAPNKKSLGSLRLSSPYSWLHSYSITPMNIPCSEKNVQQYSASNNLLNALATSCGLPCYLIICP